MGAGISGLGLWLPDAVRENDAWPPAFVEAFRDKREQRRRSDFTHIEKRSSGRPHDDLFVRHALPYDDDPFKGARRRHVADPEVPTAVGDARAGALALEDAGIRPDDVDLVLSSAVVQDRLVPSNGPAIQHLLGCTRAAGLGVEGYCASAPAQLDLASGLVDSGRARFVLCVQSHQLNRINDLELPASPIFGDASAAFVVGRLPEGRGVVRVVRGGDGSLAGAVTHAFKETPGATWWRDAKGPVVPGIDDLEAARTLAKRALEYPIETIRELLRATEMPVDAIAALAMIQPLPWYQPAVAEALGLPPDRVPSTFDRWAHLGGAGVVANLLEARRRGLLRERAPVVLYAHGAGIARYAALIRW